MAVDLSFVTFVGRCPLLGRSAWVENPLYMLRVSASPRETVSAFFILPRGNWGQSPISAFLDLVFLSILQLSGPSHSSGSELKVSGTLIHLMSPLEKVPDTFNSSRFPTHLGSSRK